ncbi:TetR/AcrR family transcriptional regulator [Acinetobacter indicus]|uniref:TetR/AcrR family transcriptional regulator n=1 Tax=Acinetobacter indicus TaxID=756892 RepID=UPI002574DD5C|nr:TetR/AcrR family transcriptional regulator [Acinetobacter indicus]MDM1243881.1 TetR/AcrR family transcriptional regulator [Acinetobacter indicus]MDM1287934.1 TetR/AcrR family transcriptional regulator [Acinetobacter indicus]
MPMEKNGLALATDAEPDSAILKPKPRKRRANTEARHEDKRLLILKTAAELFATQGYEATSLDLIAEHVGIHKATLYHYITNKETILYECLLTSFKDLDILIEEMKNTEVCVFDRLRKFATQLAIAQNNVFGRCLILVGARPLDSGSGNEIKDFQRRLELTVRELVEEGIADGKIKPRSSRLFSAMLFGALNWVPRWYKEGRGEDITEIVDVFMSTLIDGIRA